MSWRYKYDNREGMFVIQYSIRILWWNWWVVDCYVYKDEEIKAKQYVDQKNKRC